MRLGLVTPVVQLIPNAYAPWEEAAGIDEVTRVARAADRAGYEFLTASEHVGIPEDFVQFGGSRIYDPLATLSWIAAQTERIRLVTYVLNLTFHHPASLAKSYGTLDTISGGRVVLGVGFGSLPPEMSTLGFDPSHRVRDGVEKIAVLRDVLGRREWNGLVIEPHAVQPRMPIWLGGLTERSLARAAEVADGWIPAFFPPAQLAELLARVELPPGFEVAPLATPPVFIDADALAVVVGDTGGEGLIEGGEPPRPLDPVADPHHAERVLTGLAEAGATIATIPGFVNDSLGHYLEQVEAMASIAAKV